MAIWHGGKVVEWCNLRWNDTDSGAAAAVVRRPPAKQQLDVKTWTFVWELDVKTFVWDFCASKHFSFISGKDSRKLENLHPTVG